MIALRGQKGHMLWEETEMNFKLIRRLDNCDFNQMMQVVVADSKCLAASAAAYLYLHT